MATGGSKASMSSTTTKRLGTAGDAPDTVNMREGIIWAYRHLLGREPNDEAAIAAHLDHKTPISLRDAFIASAEYQSKRDGSALRRSIDPLLAPFRPFSTEPASKGSWRDFLGVQTRCSFLPDSYVTWSGIVQGPPGAVNGPLHDVEEWTGTLRSVLEARDQFVVVELGAGWGPWLVGSARAATRVGIKDIQLVGVEGSSGHVDFMRMHFLDNGIDPSAHRLIHGVVGVVDGVACFPKLHEPNNNYGSEATYAANNATTEMEEVRSFSLQTLLADLPIVDLLHCDIQGMEADVFQAARDVVHQRVRRIVVGTHSRKIEAELMAIMTGLGWVLEDETACKLVQLPDRRMQISVDGTQVWSNPQLCLSVLAPR